MPEEPFIYIFKIKKNQTIFFIYSSKDNPSKTQNKRRDREHISEIKENKLENGYTILNQADCYRYIFKHLVEEEVIKSANKS